MRKITTTIVNTTVLMQHTSFPTSESAKCDVLSVTLIYLHSTAEHDRLNAQHHGIVELMHGKIIHAPVRNPRQVLDIGCGTGIVTSSLGVLFPSAEVIGIDLSPVPWTVS